MPSLSPVELQYPVLYLSRNSGVGAKASPAELTQSWPSLVRAGFFRQLRLVSADGRAYEVIRADVISRTSQFVRWWADLFDLRLQMHLELRDAGIADCATICRQLLEQMTAESEELEEHTGRSLQWWRRHLAEARSTEELVRRFADGVAAG